MITATLTKFEAVSKKDIKNPRPEVWANIPDEKWND